MSAPAWMPFYPADYLAATGHLTPAQHGAYLLLILHYWNKGGLPTEDKMLARIARMSEREWKANRGTLAEFFSADWKHARIDKEIEKARTKSEARAEFGARGGNAKALKNKAPRVAKATVLPEQTPSKPLASSSQPQPEKKEEGATPPKVAPEKQIILDAVEAFNQTAGQVGWAKVQLMNETRETSLQKRLSEAGGLAGWVAALEKAAKSRLLTGRKTDWKADFDFLLQRKSFTKLMEGGYDDSSIQGKSGSADYSRSAADQILAAGRRKLDRLRSDGWPAAGRDESPDIFTPTNGRNGGSPAGDFGGQAPRGRDEDTNILAVSFSPPGRVG